jgi:cell division protein FtsB
MKEKIKKMKQAIVGVIHLWYFKYVVVCLLGILIVGFLDENSVLSHFNNVKRIGELREEISIYDEQNRKNKEQIRKLQEDPKAIEKIARERYFMKADDEDIFVLSDEGEQEENVEVKSKANETAN